MLMSFVYFAVLDERFKEGPISPPVICVDVKVCTLRCVWRFIDLPVNDSVVINKERWNTNTDKLCVVDI